MFRSRTMSEVLLAAALALPLVLAGCSSGSSVDDNHLLDDQRRRRPAATDPITIAYISSTSPGREHPRTARRPPGSMPASTCRTPRAASTGTSWCRWSSTTRPARRSIATAVQSAISKGAFGIVSQSPLFFLAAKYPQQAGVPVTGSYDDGPEWGTQPYTNMFASDNGSVTPSTRSTPRSATSSSSTAGRFSAPTATASRRRPAGRPSARPGRSSTPGARSGSWTPPSPSAAWTSPSTALVAKQNNINAHGARPRQQLQLRAGHRAQAGRGQAQGGPVRHRLRARHDQVPGVEHPAG